MVNEFIIRNEIVNAGKRLKSEGLIVSTDGNISFRGKDCIFITPSGYDKGDLRDEDIVRVDNGSKSIEGILPKPSMEIFMHMAVYENRNDINAIIHTHAAFSTVFAIRGISPDYGVLLESEMLPKAVILGEYKPGSRELAEQVGQAGGESNIILLKKHGIVVLGENMEKALETVERFEFLCKVNIFSNLL